MEEFKGPWSVIEHSWSDSSIVNVHGETVASLSIYEEATEETQDALESQMSAYFKLISAAPDMLYALRELSRVYKEKGQLLAFDVSIALRALDKALGK